MDRFARTRHGHVAIGIACGRLLLWTLAGALPRPASAGCDVTLLSAVPVGERVRDVEVVGNIAYLAAGFDGLRILDVTNPAAPVPLGSVPTTAFSQDVKAVGSLVYVAESDFEGPGGLRVIDVSDPLAPTELSRAEVSVTRIDVLGSVVFATDPVSGLHVFDASDPANIVEIASLDMPGFENDIHVFGSLAYLLVDPPRSFPTLQILDVSNPAAPLSVGSTGTGVRIPFDIAVDGALGYVPVIGLLERGLMIYDMSSPTAPVELAFLQSASSRSVQSAGSHAYFAFGVDSSFGGGPGGFRVIDVSNPQIPVDVGGAGTGVDESTAIAVQPEANGDRLFVSTSGSEGGLRIFRVSSCPDVIAADVIPSSATNWVPMTADTPVPVEIMGSPSVDVTSILYGSLRFGPAGATPYVATGYEPVIDDLNGDGFDDLLVFFLSSDAGFRADDQQACVEGLRAGVPFVACDWIKVNQPPVAAVFSEPRHGIAPVWVTFDATSSYDREGGTLLYDWQFGTWAQPDSQPIVSRLLPAPGDYEVTLTVEDEFGQTASTLYLADAVEAPAVSAVSEWALRILATLLLGAGIAAGRYRSDAPG